MKALKRLLIVLGVLCFILIVLQIIPPKKAIENNPFIINEGERPLIAAHRGGKTLNPENTFKAMDFSVENYNIDIIEHNIEQAKTNIDLYIKTIKSYQFTINEKTNFINNLSKK